MHHSRMGSGAQHVIVRVTSLAVVEVKRDKGRENYYSSSSDQVEEILEERSTTYGSTNKTETKPVNKKYKEEKNSIPIGTIVRMHGSLMRNKMLHNPARCGDGWDSFHFSAAVFQEDASRLKSNNVCTKQEQDACASLIEYIIFPMSKSSGGLFHPPFFRTERDQDKNQQKSTTYSLKIMSFNTWNFNGPWAARHRYIAGEMVSHWADVIALQEVRYHDHYHGTQYHPPAGNNKPGASQFASGPTPTRFAGTHILSDILHTKSRGTFPYSFAWWPSMAYYMAPTETELSKLEVEGLMMFTNFRRVQLLDVIACPLTRDLFDEDHQRMLLCSVMLLSPNQDSTRVDKRDVADAQNNNSTMKSNNTTGASFHIAPSIRVDVCTSHFSLSGIHGNRNANEVVHYMNRLSKKRFAPLSKLEPPTSHHDWCGSGTGGDGTSSSHSTGRKPFLHNSRREHESIPPPSVQFFCGDLNAQWTEGPLQILNRSLFHDTFSSWRATTKQQGTKPIEFTGNTFSSQYNAPMEKRIDFILYRSVVKEVKVRVAQWKFAGERTRFVDAASDHLGIVASFDIEVNSHE